VLLRHGVDLKQRDSRGESVLDALDEDITKYRAYRIVALKDALSNIAANSRASTGETSSTERTEPRLNSVTASAPLMTGQRSRDEIMNRIEAYYDRSEWDDAERECARAEQLHVADAGISTLCRQMRQTRQILSQ
ncbi:MAG: hypothetical protein ACREBW_10665, partial [Candidatus Micrarchaeaceae archaeon]